MFTYCLNNPIYYSDPTGDIAVPAFVWAGLINGVANFFCTLISTGSIGEAFAAFVRGFVEGALAYSFGIVGIIIDVIHAVETYIDCYQSGMSEAESITVAAASYAIDQVSFASTGDELTDYVVEATFGMVIPVTKEAALVGMQNESERNQIVPTYDGTCSSRQVPYNGKPNCGGTGVVLRIAMAF